MVNKVAMIIGLFLVVLIGYKLFSSLDTNYDLVYEKYPNNEVCVYFYNNSELVEYIYYINDEDKVLTIFNLLSNESNVITLDYQTFIPLATKIINYETVNKTLFINLNEDFLRYEIENSSKIINQLKKSYSNIGYDNLMIKVNGELLKNIGDININDGIKLD